LNDSQNIILGDHSQFSSKAMHFQTSIWANDYFHSNREFRHSEHSGSGFWPCPARHDIADQTQWLLWPSRSLLMFLGAHGVLGELNPARAAFVGGQNFDEHLAR
jgi:hypothetical protein